MVSDGHPLIDAYLKAEWANEHLNSLKAALGGFINSKPCTVSVEHDTERKLRRYSAVLKQPNVSIYLIAGDVFQCLRTALDQAVWGLAAINFPDPDWTQFPILGEDNTETEKTFLRYTRGIPDEAVAVIKSLQPYSRDQGEPVSANSLWQLHEINRIDKHRRISVRATATYLTHHRLATVTAVNNSYEVAVPFNAEPALEPEFTPFIVFGDRAAGISIPIDGVERIYNIVRNFILPKLAGCIE